VHWHFGGIQGHADAPPNLSGDHLALTVADEWYADAGIGDGLHEPLPLAEGVYTQGPHTYGLGPSALSPGGWRFTGDPKMSVYGMDFRAGDTSVAELLPNHQRHQESPDSSFNRVLVVFRRDATGVDYLRGCVFTRIAAGEESTELTTSADWFACLADVFDLPLSDVDDERKAALWKKVSKSHEQWLAKRAAESAAAASQ
jgi:arylamine N-acetyltransferase